MEPGKGFIGLLLPEGFEKRDCLAVGEDVEEPQDFHMDAAGCRQECMKEFDFSCALFRKHDGELDGVPRSDHSKIQVLLTKEAITYHVSKPWTSWS